MQMTHVAVAMAATASLLASASQGATTTGTLRPYSLKAGTRLEYATSASLVVDGPMAQKQGAQFTETYTVIEAKDDLLTLYAAVDPKADPATSASRRQKSPPGRFTFQLSPSGELGENVAGFSRPSFPGWTPAMDFPVIPAEDVSTVTMAIPFMDRPTELKAIRKASGPNVVVNYVYEPTDQAWESSGINVKSYRATITYSTVEHSVLSARYETRAEGMRMQEKLGLTVALETNRTAVSEVAPEKFDSLKKDVAEGVQLFGKLQAALGAGDGQVTAAQSLIRDYLKTHPAGEFTPLYQLFQKDLEQMGRMGLMKNNFARIIAGKPAPAFEAKSIDGQTIKLADLKGKVVLLDFWATWCAPCVAEVPAMKKIWDANKDKGFVIVGVSGDNEEEALRDFVKERELPWKQIYQPDIEDSSVMFIYGVGKFPTTVLIDREGIIQAVDLRGEELAAEVERLVTGKQPAAADANTTR
jgi:peroxiredoxin